MSKTLFYRLFGLGAIPRNAVAQIQKEGVVLQDEGIGGSVTFKKFRAPGKYYSWRRNWFSGSIVLTRKHFLAFRYSQPIIGVSWADAEFKELRIQLEDRNTLGVGFEASAFQENASGEIEVRLSTPLAQDFLTQIEQLVAANQALGRPLD